MKSNDINSIANKISQFEIEIEKLDQVSLTILKNQYENIVDILDDFNKPLFKKYIAIIETKIVKK